MPAVAASRPLEVPVTALELNRFCHTTASPLGHDVGEDEDGAEVFPPGQIGAGDQKGEQTAEYNGYHTGPYASHTVLSRGVHRLIMALSLVNRSM